MGWPSRILKKGGGFDISMKFLGISCFAAGLILSDLFLKEAYGHNPIIAEQIIDYMRNHTLGLESTSDGDILTIPLVSGIIGTTFTIGILGEILGRFSDGKRAKLLPEQALSYCYGTEAGKEIVKENAIMTNELKKQKAYNKALSKGADIPKKDFLEIIELSEGSSRKGY